MAVLKSIFNLNVGNKEIENKILEKLNEHDALGEIKLYDMVTGNDNSDSLLDYNNALGRLLKKGLIDLTTDPYNTMTVVRLVQVIH